MSKTKYPEKKYLSTYELSLNFFNELGIKVNDIIPLRKVFILKTTDGNKILKKVDYDIDRIEFVNECVDNLGKYFKNIILLNKFKDGNNFKEWRDSFYVVMDLIPGREASFTNPVEIKMCAELLANMHKASKKVIKEKRLESKLDRSIEDKFKESLQDMNKIKELIDRFKYKNNFDLLFSENIDLCIDCIKESLKLISLSKYDEYRSNIDNIAICHNDLAEHNFLYSNNEMHLIDFDYCSVDYRVMDIADIILKGIKNVAFEPAKAIDLIKAYDNIYPLKQEDYKMIYILLLFPRDICTLGKSYYFKQKDWEEEVFINRLKNKLQNEEFRKEFLYEYKKVFKNKF
ncbi:MAG: CotS family spore coat protein [Clostridium sp.]|nr:CotS family spore coat protein [Clostridium sp.]